MLIGAITVLGGALALAPPTQAGASATGITFTRLAGTDVYGTAQTVAEKTFTVSSTAILATSSDPFDAAAGNYLSGVLRAPVLYTAPTSLPAATAHALANMGVHSVLVLGGSLAVGDAIVTQLRTSGYQVTRISGGTVYQTAQAITAHVGAASVGISGSSDPTAVIAAGWEPGDLQSVGPLAYAGPFPLLFASQAGLPSATVDSLKSLGIRHAIILGGKLAVPASAETTLTSLGITSERLTGSTNLDTAVDVANFEVGSLGFTNTHVNIARGNDFADAVVGGSHAGAMPSPLLLTANQTVVGSATLGWLSTNCATLATGTIFGGPLAVSDGAVAAMTTAATCPVTGGGGTGGGGTGGGGGGTTGSTTAPPTTLTLSTSTTSPSVGSTVTVTATVTADGTPVRNAPVDFFAVDVSTEGGSGGGSGTGTCTISKAATPGYTGTTACTIDPSDPKTNSAGKATFTFGWTYPVGQRPVEGTWPMTVYAFTGATGATYPSSTPSLNGKVTIAWTNAVTSLVFTPAAPVYQYGATTEIGVTLSSTSAEGTTAPVPIANQSIVWSAYRGATCTPSSTVPPTGTAVEHGTAPTDATGTAWIRYQYNPTPAPTTNTVDCLFAYYDANTNATLDSGELAKTTTVTWSSTASAATTLTLTPQNGSALVGEAQTLTATVEDQYGNGVATVPVSWTITGSSNSSGTGTTDGTGEVAIALPSSETTGELSITVTAGSLSATTKAYWVKEATDGTYTGTVLGSQSTAENAGYLDVAITGGQYLRFYFDTGDVLMVGTSTVRAERFLESAAPGTSITITYHPTGVSTFKVAGSGGGGGGGGGHGGGGSGS